MIWNGRTTPPNELEPAWDDEGEVEVMTPAEKRIAWICDDWRDALEGDNYEEWRDIRMMAYAAKQMINTAERFDSDTYWLLHEIGEMAHQNSRACISEGKYEGAESQASENRHLETPKSIGDFAHDSSTGLVVPDNYWGILEIAYEAFSSDSTAIDSSIRQALRPVYDFVGRDYAHLEPKEALDAWSSVVIKHAKREALLEAADWFYENAGQPDKVLRRMADELKGDDK